MANLKVKPASQLKKAEPLSANDFCNFVQEGTSASVVTLETSSNANKGITIVINYKLCKACGICSSFCPKGVYDNDQFGKVVIINAEACIGCRVCENLCPDYCIKIGG